MYAVPHRRSGTRVPKPSTAAPPARAARNDREARYYEAMRIMLAWPAEPLSAASAELDRALDDDPRFAWGWVGRAQLALKEAYINGSDYDAKKTALARKHLDYAATLGPKDVEWYSVDAWVSRAEKKPGLAKESIRSALSLDADAYYALLAAAKIELDDHDYAGAVKHLTKVVERSRSKERLEWAYALLGDAYRGMGDIDALDEACSQAEALAPKNAWAFGNHAAHLLALGEVDRAIEKAEHALSLMDYGAARTVLASAHVQKGDDALWVARDGALAMREYEKALAASKSAAMAYYGRAAALRARAFEEKKPEPLAQARKDLETARTMVPDYKQYVRALEELDIIEREKLWEAK